MAKPAIVIHVKGGVVQEVDVPIELDVDVLIKDWDDCNANCGLDVPPDYCYEDPSFIGWDKYTL